MTPFHCPGTCWREEGGVEQLHRDLWSASPELAAWFGEALWASELEPSTHPIPHEVHALQDYLDIPTVDAYRRAGLSLRHDVQAGWEQYPTLFRWRGRWYVFQGTHRIAAFFDTGSYLGWRIDVDALIDSIHHA